MKKFRILFICICCVGILCFGLPIAAAQEQRTAPSEVRDQDHQDLTELDQEIIDNMDLLENLDLFLQEDLELLHNLELFLTNS